MDPVLKNMNRPPWRGRRSIRVVLGVVVLALLAGLGIAVISRRTADRDPREVVGAAGSPATGIAATRTSPPGPSPTAAVAPTPPEVTPTTTISPFALGQAVNVYANAAAGHMSPAVAGVPTRIYVPNSDASTVDVVDPTTLKVISTFAVPQRPQHVVPSWDMKTLYVNSDRGNALTPIDPVTGQPGRVIPVTDPYNLYFTPDGTHAIVVPELFNSLDFRDPHTFNLIKRVPLPCNYPNHMDFTADGTSLVTSCEGSGQLVRVNLVSMTVTGQISLGKSPQDIRLSPDGSVFYVADQDLGGVSIVNATTLAKEGFIATGAGTHGMYPSRDATQLYVSNRLAGTISVIDYATRTIVNTWHIPGGSPDMGGVSADGTQLWLSGRYNSEIYRIDTHTGALTRIPVGAGPHGLCLFPQPGAISLGHTGNYR